MTRRLLLAAALSPLGCARHPALPVLGQVPDFTLTDQTGAPFHGSSLRGRLWIADFIYTHCPGPCPLMSRRMRRIQQATGRGVRLVSFSVDPARDTPAVLAAYARRFGALPGRWSFLTGDVKTLDLLERGAFKLGSLDAQLNHSTRFVLVDGAGLIRAYYGMGDESMIEHVAADIANMETARP